MCAFCATGRINRGEVAAPPHRKLCDCEVLETSKYTRVYENIRFPRVGSIAVTPSEFIDLGAHAVGVGLIYGELR